MLLKKLPSHRIRHLRIVQCLGNPGRLHTMCHQFTMKSLDLHSMIRNIPATYKDRCLHLLWQCKGKHLSRQLPA